MTKHDDNGITQRLTQALESEARDIPLPVDLAAMIADGLVDRPSRRQPFLALPALVGVTGLAVVLIATVWALTPPPAPVPGSSTSPSAVASSQSVAHFSREQISFDYPAGWRLIEQGIEARHYQWIPVVLGTGEWNLNCQAIPPSGDLLGGVECGADIFTIDPGEIVVELFTWDGPGSCAENAPPDALTLPSGLRASVVETESSATWQVFVPGWNRALTIDARFRPPGAEEARSAVRSLVESLVVRPASAPRRTCPPEPEPSQRPPGGLTETQAVEVARAAAGMEDLSAINVAKAGPAGDVLEPNLQASVPSNDTWVWYVVVSDGGPPFGQEGVIVVLDYIDGTIYKILHWIS